MALKLFDHRRLSLGEGINIDHFNGDIAWVDINNKLVFYKSNFNNMIDSFKLQSTPSSILKIEQRTLTILDDQGVGSLNTEDGKYIRLKTYDFLANDKFLRANDGLLYEDKLYFGVMGFNPNLRTGYVYKDADNITTKLFECNIPNTFIKNENFIYISDSSKQLIYKYDLNFDLLSVWKNFSNSNYVPDGGCLDGKGGFFICMWGSGEIHNYLFSGELLEIIDVPVKNPTKCVLAGNDLIVTSAHEDVSQIDYIKWPQSGMTIKVKIKKE